MCEVSVTGFLKIGPASDWWPSDGKAIGSSPTADKEQELTSIDCFNFWQLGTIVVT